MKYSITNKEDMGKTYQVLKLEGVSLGDRTHMLHRIEKLIDKDTLLVYPGKGLGGLRGTEFIKMMDSKYNEDTDTVTLSITSNEGIVRFLIDDFQRRFFVEHSETKESVN